MIFHSITSSANALTCQVLSLSVSTQIYFMNVKGPFTQLRKPGEPRVINVIFQARKVECLSHWH